MSKAREYIAGLASKGLYHFTSIDAQQTMGISHAAAKQALARLARQGLLASPARGFYIIVPPEYKRLGCLPADQFVPDLMKESQLSYYAALLTAAQYYGAAHHRPQEFQVVVERNRRPIVCGSIRVAFIASKRIAETPMRQFNTLRGTIRVSTVEATALDLVGYAHHAGGLDQAVTVLADLADQLDPDKLAAVAKSAPMPWAQRLGYLLELVDAADKASPLKQLLHSAEASTVPLLPSSPTDGSMRNRDWHLMINTTIEPET
jgi:predicted transcriptional regulator of viral defense system